MTIPVPTACHDGTTTITVPSLAPALGRLGKRGVHRDATFVFTIALGACTKKRRLEEHEFKVGPLKLFFVDLVSFGPSCKREAPRDRECGVTLNDASESVATSVTSPAKQSCRRARRVVVKAEGRAWLRRVFEAVGSWKLRVIAPRVRVD